MKSGTPAARKRSSEMESDARWHLDKRVPIALIITFVSALTGQTLGAVWWARGMDARVENLERTSLSSAPIPDRLTRVEAKLEFMQEGISEIKRLIQARRP